MTEARELPKWRLVLALAALFLSSMCTMGDLVISPIGANLFEVFSDAPEWLIDLGLTGPALVGLPFGLLTGFLCDRIDKKLIMVVGFSIFTVAGVFGIAITSIWYFVTMRLFATGVAWGITNTAALSILADLFTDENEHGKYVGWYNSAMSVIGAVLSFVAGNLAVASWSNVYLTYLAAIPVLVMLVVFLPKFPPVEHVAPEVEEVYGKSTSSAAAIARSLFNADPKGKGNKGWWHALVPLVVQVFFVAVLYYVLLYMSSIYIADAHVGNEAFAGTVTSVMTIAAALGSLIFGFAYKRLRNAVYLPALIVLGLVFFALAYFPSATATLIALGIAGFMWPFYFCYFYTHCTEIVPSSKQSTSTSVVASSNGLAMACSSQMLMGLIGTTGGSTLTVYPLFGAAMLVIAGVSALAFSLSKKAHMDLENAQPDPDLQ